MSTQRLSMSLAATVFAATAFACAGREDGGRGVASATALPTAALPSAAAPPSDLCTRPAGAPVAFQAVATSGTGSHGASGGIRVITSEEQLRPLGVLYAVPTVERPTSPAVTVDFATSRVAAVWVRPSSSIAWVVETADAVVVGVVSPVQCGGAGQIPVVIGAVLPRSDKPVHLQSCLRGKCGSGIKAP